jgi:hypothetical protein
VRAALSSKAIAGKSVAKRLEAVCAVLKAAGAPCEKKDAKNYLAVNNIDLS